MTCHEIAEFLDIVEHYHLCAVAFCRYFESVGGELVELGIDNTNDLGVLKLLAQALKEIADSREYVKKIFFFVVFEHHFALVCATPRVVGAAQYKKRVDFVLFEKAVF